MTNVVPEEVQLGLSEGVIDAERCKVLGLHDHSAIALFLNAPGNFKAALSDRFDPVAYAETYPDIAEAGLHPLVHFIRHGKSEGRHAFPVFAAVICQLAEDARPVWIETHDLSLTGAPIALAHLLQGWPSLAKTAILGTPVAGALGPELQSTGAKVVVHGQSARRATTRAEAGALVQRCHSLLQQSGAQMVIANSFLAWPMVLAARLIGCPAHWIIHEPYQDEMRALCDPDLFGDIASHMPETASLIFVSQDSSAAWGAQGLQNTQVIEKALPVAPRIPRDRGRKAANCKDGDILVLSVGSISPRKGQLDLIAALEQLVDDPVSARLVTVLVGYNASDYAQKVLKRMQGLRKAGMRLFLLPESRSPEDRRTVQDLFAAADVFCMTSHAESLPLTTSEALAAGCPVLSSDAPGIRNLIDDGLTGLLYPVGDSNALAGRLVRLAKGDDLRAWMRSEIDRRPDTGAFAAMVKRYREIIAPLPDIAAV